MPFLQTTIYNLYWSFLKNPVFISLFNPPNPPYQGGNSINETLNMDKGGNSINETLNMDKGGNSINETLNMDKEGNSINEILNMDKEGNSINEILNRNNGITVGVDEAGRGCLAGPVFAGAVILNFPQQFKDSKSLSAKQRQTSAKQIKKKHRFAVAQAETQEIDSLNIHQASLLAMKRAVQKLHLKPGRILIDGSFKIPGLPEWEQIPIVKGDQKIHCIAAASILAKCSRDQWLCDLSRKYPQYGFDQHKGYPTLKHKKAIQKYGPCAIHRKTFKGVKEYC